MEQLIKNIQEELECSICLEQLTNPKILDCLHAFCDKCLVKIDYDSTTLCPLCNNYTISAHIKKDFIRNNFIDIINNNQLIETLKKKESKIEIHFNNLVSWAPGRLLLSKSAEADLIEVPGRLLLSKSAEADLIEVPRRLLLSKSASADLKEVPSKGLYSCSFFKYGITINCIVISDVPKWLHTYVTYTTDNWKTTHKTRRTNFLCKKKYSIDIKYIILNISHYQKTQLSFAICIYDDFGNYYWDNNNGWNYGFDIRKINDQNKNLLLKNSDIIIISLGDY